MITSGWGLAKASGSAGSSKLGKERQPLGHPGHGDKKRIAPVNEVGHFYALRWSN